MQMQQPNSQPQGLLQDFLTHTHTLTTFPNELQCDDSFLASSSSFLELISSSLDPTFTNLESFTPVNVLDNAWSYEQEVFDYDYGCEYYDKKPRSLVSVQEEYPTMLEQVDAKVHVEHQVVVSDNQKPNVFNTGEKKSKSKNVQGQPSKNLMAERRRRKRLNDRLSMLRSIVPRISKVCFLF